MCLLHGVIVSKHVWETDEKKLYMMHTPLQSVRGVGGETARTKLIRRASVFDQHIHIKLT